jgi:hypothetical protein
MDARSSLLNSKSSKQALMTSRIRIKLEAVATVYLDGIYNPPPTKDSK